MSGHNDEDYARLNAEVFGDIAEDVDEREPRNFADYLEEAREMRREWRERHVLAWRRQHKYSKRKTETEKIAALSDDELLSQLRSAARQVAESIAAAELYDAEARRRGLYRSASVATPKVPQP